MSATLTGLSGLTRLDRLGEAVDALQGEVPEARFQQWRNDLDDEREAQRRAVGLLDEALVMVRGNDWSVDEVIDYVASAREALTGSREPADVIGGPCDTHPIDWKA